jgi:ABC-type branched-subunit amino acid transport system ATPase component/branched-subunit amino acid ABC-type transport system permease component
MEVVRFAVLGLATGAIFGLLAQGLVLIYRGSGLVNFAQGAIAMFGAYVYYELTVNHGWPVAAAAVASIILCGVLGALIQVIVLRSMRNSSALSRCIATLGIVLILQSAANIRYGQDTLAVPSLLPTRDVDLFSARLQIGLNSIYIFGICIVLGIILFLFYRYTSFGRVTTAVAEHDLVAATLGHSPNVVATINWVIGSMLAGLAGVLIAPITFLQPTTLVLLVIPAMAAALIGQFKSFPIAFLAALVLGVAQSEMNTYVSSPGWGTAAPFIAIIILLILRGRSLPLRSFVLDRLPTVGNGRHRWPVVIVLGGALCSVALIADANWSAAIATTASMAIIGLSVVVLTGYAGQLSLAQFVLAGVGAYVAARLSAYMPFWVVLAVAAVLTGVIGGLVGLPALRTRGITLAVATLCLGGALVAVVLNNSGNGISVPTPTFFGWDVDPLFRGNRYAFIAVVLLLLLSLAITNLRRGVTGRLMLATRSNERAAAALGVNVAWVKTYAFVVAAAIAAIGGTVLAFMQPTVTVSNFDVFTSILIVAATVVGGIGYIAGAYIGSLIISGGILSLLLSGLPQINDYLPLIGGLVLVANLMVSPDGLVEMNRRGIARLLAARGKHFTGGRGAKRGTHVTLARPAGTIHGERRGLTVRGVSVSFGGVDAVRDVSLTIQPGEVYGLIGPNGAGKTTLIDAITGFVKVKGGDVFLGDAKISRWSPHRRAAFGLSRSFQSLELFTDLTIAENLAVAVESSSWHSYVTDFFWPGRIELSPAASEALRQFDLGELVNTTPKEISFGKRKAVAIARAVASSPSVLLLDEPAAGLDDHEAAELATLIRDLADTWRIAILLVEHNVDMIMSVSDRVTVMQNGAVLAEGSPGEILSNSAVVDAYLGVVADAALDEGA